MLAEKYIRLYNNLDGKPATRESLERLLHSIQKEIESRRIDKHSPLGIELFGVESRLATALSSVEGPFDVVELKVKRIDVDAYVRLQGLGYAPPPAAFVKMAKSGKLWPQKRKPRHDQDNRKTIIKEVKVIEKPDNLVAEEIDISKVHTDTKRFQNRQDAFSEASADSVALNYDPNKFDPIVVWMDTKAKKLFVLSGHSRLEGMKRRKSKTISVRYFKGSEQEAIKFAKVEANRGATQENLLEDLAAYRLMRDGDESKNIAKLNKGELAKIFKGKVSKLEAYSFLSAGGLFVNALSQATTSNYPYLERNAQWIGQLRKDYPQITNAGEDNIFHFFYSDKAGRHLKLSKDDFFKLAIKKINQLGKDEGVLFPECGTEGCKAAVDKESDPQKGEAYKRLREINETLTSIKEKLTSKKANVRVSTEDEKKYLRSTGEKLEAEKERILRDLDLIDKSQASLFGNVLVNRSEYAPYKKERYYYLTDAEIKKLNESSQGKYQWASREEGSVIFDKIRLVESLQYKFRDGQTAKQWLDARIADGTIKDFRLNKDQKQYAQMVESGQLNGPQYDAFEVKRVKPTKGLNKLQRAQLHDSIKAGATVKVNSQNAKGAKKGWTDTPLFRSELESRQSSLFGAEDIAKMQFTKLNLTEPYLHDFNRLYSDTMIMLWAAPGSGKTVYALKFGQYLAEKLNLKVLYVAKEEMNRSTFTEKIIQFNIGHPNLKFSKELVGVNVDEFDAIIFDSVQALGMDLAAFQQFVKEHPGKLLVPIIQSTKDGDFRGGKDWEHEVDIAGEIVDRKFVARKNRLDEEFAKKREKHLLDQAVAEQQRKELIKGQAKPKPVEAPKAA